MGQAGEAIVNRYMVEGIIRDAQAGKGVLCVIPPREVQRVITELEPAAGIVKLRRSYGSELILFGSGGTISFASPAHRRMRDISVDIAVIDDVYYRDQMLDLHADLTVLVAPRGGEIVTYT